MRVYIYIYIYITHTYNKTRYPSTTLVSKALGGKLAKRPRDPPRRVELSSAEASQALGPALSGAYLCVLSVHKAQKL